MKRKYKNQVKFINNIWFLFGFMKEIEIFVYCFVHKEGVILLYCNNSKKNYQETIHLTEMKNLVLYSKEGNVGQKKLEIEVEPGNQDLVFFNKTGNEEFSFRFKNMYKV